jgi:RNA 3'-terminal phosphate cyclase (ATP)
MSTAQEHLLRIDGSFGEGGGQILRSALTLSLLTNRAFQIDKIRAARDKPGLRPQHLAATGAASKISDATVEGASLSSGRLVFSPAAVKSGAYHFSIGTAGATSLVLQTIFLPLALASGPSDAPLERSRDEGQDAKRPSKVTITGGTHTAWSPCFHYLDQVWLDYLRKMGIKAKLTLERCGFYPQGGGQISAEIFPASPQDLQGIELMERGELKSIRGISAVANLPESIALRQKDRAVKRLHRLGLSAEIEIQRLSSPGKGTLLFLLVEFEHSRVAYFGLGAIGKRAERVADEAVDGLEDFLQTDGAVDEHLADQILLPLAFASGPSAYRTSRITRHLQTNAFVLEQFLAAHREGGPREIEIEGSLNEEGVVLIGP